MNGNRLLCVENVIYLMINPILQFKNNMFKEILMNKSIE